MKRHNIPKGWRDCWNCKDRIDAAKRIALCPVCAKTYGIGALIGGVIGGIIVRLFA